MAATRSQQSSSIPAGARCGGATPQQLLIARLLVAAPEKKDHRYDARKWDDDFHSTSEKFPRKSSTILSTEVPRGASALSFLLQDDCSALGRNPTGGDVHAPLAFGIGWNSFVMRYEQARRPSLSSIIHPVCIQSASRSCEGVFVIADDDASLPLPSSLFVLYSFMTTSNAPPHTIIILPRPRYVPSVRSASLPALRPPAAAAACCVFLLSARRPLLRLPSVSSLPQLLTHVASQCFVVIAPTLTDRRMTPNFWRAQHTRAELLPYLVTPTLLQGEGRKFDIIADMLPLFFFSSRQGARAGHARLTSVPPSAEPPVVYALLRPRRHQALRPLRPQQRLLRLPHCGRLLPRRLSRSEARPAGPAGALQQSRSGPGGCTRGVRSGPERGTRVACD